MTAPDILAIQTVGELRALRPEDFADRELTPEEIRHIFELCDAFWMYSGDPKDPHAELTSGLCSNGFIDCLQVLCHTNLCQIMAHQIVLALRKHYTGPVDWVLGSAYAALDLSKDVANILGAKHVPLEKGPEKTQEWKRLDIGPDEIVLQVEELMTTSGTTEAVRRGIEEGNPEPVEFAPVIIVLIHRSGVYKINGQRVIPVVHYDIQNWDPSECPHCAAGSERLRPKQNWARLTGKAA